MTRPLAAVASSAPDRSAAAVEGPDIRLRGLVKRFGSTLAVDQLDLDIMRGEFFSLLGPSGCGKSTTLAMIGGFEMPTSGSIELAGRDVARVPPYRRDVNTVFQSYALFPHLTVADNVAFGLRRKRVPREQIVERVREALRLVDLPGFENRKPTQLSGGQQQRVALARALVNEPRVLLLDEPLGALDLKLRKQMQQELKRIQSEIAVTFIYVTHDQEEAMVMSDRLAVMNAGHIEQVGSPEQVYDRPQTEFVAGFLGASNLLAGTVSERGEYVTQIRLASGQQVQVPSDRVPNDDEVNIGIRPEKLRLHSSSESLEPGFNSVQGTVMVATYLGVSHQYQIAGPDGADITVYVQNLAMGPPPPPGAEVRVAWHPEHTFVIARTPAPAQGAPETHA